MTETNIFEQASRQKLRINSVAGYITTEQLWDLPLKSSAVSLDEIAKNLHKEIKSCATESFVDDNVEVDPKFQLAFDIVLHIVKVKKEEQKIAQDKKLLDQKKARIMEAIAKKEDQKFDDASMDELKEMLADL